MVKWVYVFVVIYDVFCDELVRLVCVVIVGDGLDVEVIIGLV